MKSKDYNSSVYNNDPVLSKSLTIQKDTNQTLMKDNRGVPIIQSTPNAKFKVSSISSLHRSKTINIDNDHEIHDEIQLCKIRNNNNNNYNVNMLIQNPIAQNQVLATHHQSSHMNSSRFFSESWQDASTEPLFPDSPMPVSQNYIPIINRKKKESELSYSKSLNISPSREEQQPILQPTPQSEQNLTPIQIIKNNNLLKRKEFIRNNDEISNAEITKRKRYATNEAMNSFSSKLLTISPQRETQQPVLQLTPQSEQKVIPPTSNLSKKSTNNDTPLSEKKEENENSEKTITNNSQQEHEQKLRITENINRLMSTVTCLPKYYKLKDKIGEGTFSTVYMAEDVRHRLYNNDEWKAQLITSEYQEAKVSLLYNKNFAASDKEDLNEFVALKHIYSTSSPKRIAKEIKILKILKGSKCISPLITAFREQDHVFMVMPYIKHDDFRENFSDMSVIEIKYYMKSLLTALQELYKFKIIHRDIKPNNFLYNRRKRVGYLIDFGLAENEEECKALDTKSGNQARQRLYNLGYSKRKTNSTSNPSHLPSSSLAGKNTVVSTFSNKENTTTEFSSTTSLQTSAVETLIKKQKPSLNVIPNINSSQTSISENERNHKQDRKPECVAGRIKNDPRIYIRANRAGTRGFRAPEVLFRVTRQTCAIDVWSAGVVLLCFLTSRYPFFLASEEAEGIIEFCQIFGLKEMKACAEHNGRKLHTNISMQNERIPWIQLIENLNTHNLEQWEPVDLEQGIDLLNRLLDLHPDTRITARDALMHSFFSNI
ncbi:kinase-like domain-containing protein [Cokeromyces recurvatus]|uniref:kinase-like domain-containing protein n=1 Tax=Cokeromyces recurvatus TaxID=90255 RepID=UPI00222102BE|nr:kinase-like domain-containing protein [Cokeromyces recurvatus]KAI7905669.1 kinase-like domain-containing protein [Cokeromyces recurvatus]